MAKPVQLADGQVWPTQTAAKAHFKKLLHAYVDGQRVTDPGDHRDLLALLLAYDHGLELEESKAGVGVDYFYKDRDDEYGGVTSCFYVCRIDGSCIDFSYIKAIEHISRRHLD